MNFLECIVEKKNNALYLDEGTFEVRVVDDMIPPLEPYINKKVILGIRPENIYDKLYSGIESTKDNTINATVEVVEPMGAEIYLYLTTGKNQIIARVDAHDQASVNQDLEVIFDMNKIHIFDIDTEKTIV
jgi:multiple sugar transport system ATP-binding protein